MASSESQTQKLIGLYRSCECLWNQQSPGYLSGTVQEDAWRKITRGMNCGLTLDQVKLQVLALRTYYDAECAAIRQNKLEGCSYEPRHPYFKDLRFLGSVLPEETEESKVSFCLGQLNGILEDSLIQDDYNLIKRDYPPNFSEATFCQASLCSRTKDTKPDYTFYKLILEPEKPSTPQDKESGAVIGKLNERSVSGNDNPRWYPTSYCEPCKKPECCRRDPCLLTDSESCCSTVDSVPCVPCGRLRNHQAQRGSSCSSRSVLSQSESCCLSTGSNAYTCRNPWPRPRPCCQPRPKYVPRPRRDPMETGKDKSCCGYQWRRNNDAVGRRRRQEARNPPCCYNTHDRRLSGEDRMNLGPQKGTPQNNYQPPIGSPGIDTNQQDPDCGCYDPQEPNQGNYFDNQQAPEANTYMNNQQMQDPGRYNNDPQNQRIYSNERFPPMQPAQTAYYDPQQQFNQSPTSPPQPKSFTKSSQQYGNANYVPYQPVNDYGRPLSSDQSNVYNYGVDNTYREKLQSAAPVPATCLQDCPAPCGTLGPPDLDNRYPANPSMYTEQPAVIANGQREDYEPRFYPNNKKDLQWQPDDDRKNTQSRRGSQNQGKYPNDQQRRRSNDYDQDVDRVDRVPRTQTKSNDYVEDNTISPEFYDEIKNFRTPRNTGIDRNYEEFPAGGKPNMAEREVCRPDCNYEKCPSPRRRRPDDYNDYSETLTNRSPGTETPQRIDSRKPTPKSPKKTKKIDYVECKNPDCQRPKQATKNYNGSQERNSFSVPVADMQYVPCPAYNRQNPKEYPYYSQPNQNWQDGDDRIDANRKPPSRSWDYEDDRKPTARDRSRPPPEEIESEFESDRERMAPPKRRTRRSYDEKVPKNRQDRDVEKGKKKREVMETCCNDDTCPYRYQEKSYDDDREAKKSSRNKSPTRKSHRPADDAADYERPKKSSSSPKRSKKKKAPMDVDNCECSTDDNNYDQGGYGRYDQYGDEELVGRSSRRTSRNEPYKNNATLQRGYTDKDEDSLFYDDYRAKRGKKNPNDYFDDYACSSDSDKYAKKMDNRDYRRRGESARNSQMYKDYKECKGKRPSNKTNSSRRQSNEADVYDSECDCPTTSPKRGDKKKSSRKREYVSKESDVYDSECDCPTSSPKRGDKKKSSKKQEYKSKGFGVYDSECDCPINPPKRGDKKKTSKKPEYKSKATDVYESECDCPTNSPKRGDNKLSSRKQEYMSRESDVYDSECDCLANSSPKRGDKKRSSRKREYKSKEGDAYKSESDCFCSSDEKPQRNDRKPPPCRPRRRSRNDQRKQKNDSQDQKTTCRKNPVTIPKDEFKDCDCQCQCGGENNTTPKPKSSQAENGCSFSCCHSDPYAPQPQSFDRNPAGNGIGCGCLFDDTVQVQAALKQPSANANNPWQASYTFNIDLPLPGETKLAPEPECTVPLPSKKKKPRPGSVGPSKNARSSKQKSRAASPTHNSAKTQPVEPAKKRITSSSNGRRNAPDGAKRTTDTSAAANSKLPNDLNSALYFICKLQDDINSQQYLVVIPKEPNARSDTHRADPGQGSWKQLHCQRQFSGFQSVSWGNPAFNSVLSSPPNPPLEICDISSYAMPPDMTDTTMGIVKKYLSQTTIKTQDCLKPVVPPRPKPKTVLSGPIRRIPVQRPSTKANASILTENRTVLLTNSPFQNLSLAEDKKEVIVLHPPDPNFRPSKNSLNMEVQRIAVRSSGTDVKPRPYPTKKLPPKPPTKPK
ncbi:uncharacterized protein [Drosophila kikkawai]|uniref:Uncharacterized protein isoform X2 n=1 Tax=Drosophila kikkawai TaxID=30033 RepID=A0ABM4GAC6_DROKI